MIHRISCTVILPQKVANNEKKRNYCYLKKAECSLFLIILIKCNKVNLRGVADLIIPDRYKI